MQNAVMLSAVMLGVTKPSTLAPFIELGREQNNFERLPIRGEVKSCGKLKVYEFEP
jgi:hypothetical protein